MISFRSEDVAKKYTSQTYYLRGLVVRNWELKMKEEKNTFSSFFIIIATTVFSSECRLSRKD